jgi:predicted amidophosphoribosyltransferase
MNLLRALADTLVPPICVGCESPGDFWCVSCARQLSAPRRIAVPGISPVWAEGRYDGPVIRLIHAWKEDCAAVLDPVLATALAKSIVSVMAEREATNAVVVPIPSTPTARRRRQGEPLARATHLACELLRLHRVEVRLECALRTNRERRDQSAR